MTNLSKMLHYVNHNNAAPLPAQVRILQIYIESQNSAILGPKHILSILKVLVLIFDSIFTCPHNTAENDETRGPETDNKTNLFMIPVQLRLKYAFTLYKAMLS